METPAPQPPECNRTLIALVEDLRGYPREEAAERVMHEMRHGQAVLYVPLNAPAPRDGREPLPDQLIVLDSGTKGTLRTLVAWTADQLTEAGERNAHIGCIATQQLLRAADIKGLMAIVLDPNGPTELYISRSDLNRPLGISPVQFAPLKRDPVKPSIISRETRASRLKRT